MSRPFIVLGDRTSHGGTVVGAAGTFSTHGNRIARVGDQVTCPIPGHGTTVIVSGDNTMIIDGAPAARDGDKCACGATLIASQFVSTCSSGGGPNSKNEQIEKATAAGILAYSSNHGGNEANEHDQQFYIIDEGTGQPLKGIRYRILWPDQSTEGITDQNGLTERVSTCGESIINIEILG